MHLADSAFPIGASSHSFGLETLTAEGDLCAPEIEPFLTDLLWENGRVEALFVRIAYRFAYQLQSLQKSRREQPMNISTVEESAGFHAALGIAETSDDEIQLLFAPWLTMNRQVAAIKGARESRSASATLGRRFLETAAGLEDAPLLQMLARYTGDAKVEIHYCTAFGIVGGHLSLGEDETVLAYLQQNTMGLLSACLRLLPIGQGRAGEILWRLKAVIADVAVASSNALTDTTMNTKTPAGPSADRTTLSADWDMCQADFSLFTPLLDLGSMRHPTLRTRLFIS